MVWYKKIGLYVLSGILLGVGFVFPLLWPLGIAGAALLLHRLLVSNDSWVCKLAGAYGAMFIKFLFVLFDYWSMYPISWLPFDFGSWELVLIGLYWISVSAYIAFSGVALYGLTAIGKKIAMPPWLLYFVFVPLAWVAADIFGSFILSVITLGAGSSPNISFSLGYIGYLLGTHQIFAQIALLGGVYALSFVSVFSAALGMHFWPKWQKKEKGIALLVFVVCSISTNVSMPTPTVSSDVYNVALISTNISTEHLFERTKIDLYRDVQKEAMQAVSEIEPDYVLWPEDARYFLQLAGGMGAMVFSFTNADTGMVMIDSSVVKTDSGRVLRAEIVDVGNNKNYIADKRYLVPQGEFMPYLYLGLFNAVGLGEMATKVAGAVSYIIGPEISQSDFSSNIPGVLFCFESTNAMGVLSLIRERDNVPFIVHPVSHGWFHEPRSFWSQLDTSLRVQAIWNRVYIASAGNHAPSKLFTPQGTIVMPQKKASGEYWEVGTVEIPVK